LNLPDAAPDIGRAPVLRIADQAKTHCLRCLHILNVPTVRTIDDLWQNGEKQ